MGLWFIGVLDVFSVVSSDGCVCFAISLQDGCEFAQSLRPSFP